MLKKIIIGILLNAAALYVVTKIVSDITYTGDVWFFVIAGIIIGVLNTFVKPLMKILSFPIILITAGLFSLVINVIIFWLTVKVVNGIHFQDVTVTIGSTLTYFIAALVFGIVNWIFNHLIPNKR